MFLPDYTHAKTAGRKREWYRIIFLRLAIFAGVYSQPVYKISITTTAVLEIWLVPVKI